MECGRAYYDINDNYNDHNDHDDHDDHEDNDSWRKIYTIRVWDLTAGSIKDVCDIVAATRAKSGDHVSATATTSST